MFNGIYSGGKPYQITRQQESGNVSRTGIPQKTDTGKKTDVVPKHAEEKIHAKVTEWKPVPASSPLIPTQKAGYGTVIGDVELSDKAKEYYSKLKNKFHGMDFILVGKEEKGAVARNAAAYGNANKPVVLIDEDKLERMATDDSFRKKYEGIIAMSQTKLQEAQNSLFSSGASVRNFGMSVDADGKTSFFAVIEKSANLQKEALEKRLAKKKAEKAGEKKLEEKQERKERLERLRDKNKTENADDETASEESEPEYLKIRAASFEDLVSRIYAYAYQTAEKSLDAQEQQIGQNIDFRG